MSENSRSRERFRWDGDYSRLEYEVGEWIEDAMTARLIYEMYHPITDEPERTEVVVDVGEIASHNSWLMLFERSPRGDMWIVEPDGTVVLEFEDGSFHGDKMVAGRAVSVEPYDLDT